MALVPGLRGSYFALIMTITQDAAKPSATGFRVAAHLKSTTALLFPGLIAQINLRSRIPASGLIYITLDFVILLCAACSLIFVKSLRAFVGYGDNLVPKLPFWPILMVIFYGISLLAL